MLCLQVQEKKMERNDLLYGYFVIKVTQFYVAVHYVLKLSISMCIQPYRLNFL